MGDRVPADVLLLDTIWLRCDEASFTGESHAVDKQGIRTNDQGTVVVQDAAEVNEGSATEGGAAHLHALGWKDSHPSMTDLVATASEDASVTRTRQGMRPAELAKRRRESLALMSTLVVAGEGTGLVVATGGDTRLGQLVHDVEDAEDTKTPL